MENFSSFSKYILFGLFLCYSFTAISQDFKIQHIQDDIGNTGGTNTSFTAVSSTNSAFALANNNRKTNAGSSGTSSAFQGDDLAGARRLTATGTLTYYRESGSDPVAAGMRFNTSIWEYIGTGGGANEMIIRGRYAIPLNGTTISATQALTGVVNANKCIPFITGIMNNVTSQGADSGTAIAYLSNATTLNVLKGSNANNVTVYITVVEFTGSNWTVLHGDSGSVSADTGTITLNDNEDGNSGTSTSVSDWSEAIIFSHHIGDTGTNNVNDARSDNWPLMDPGSDNQSVDWTFNGDHNSAGTNRHFTHVLVNSNITVARFQDTSSTADESTIDITSAGLTDLSQALIVGSSTTSGTSAFYARGWRNYYFNSLTEAAHWSHRSGSTMAHEIQIVNFVAPAPVQTEGPGGITTNLELWLKADSGVEEAASDSAEDTDPVLNWLDHTINNNDAIQSTGLNKPIFAENTINFNPTVDFDGTNHEMSASAATNSQITIFAVAEGAYSSTKSLIDLDNGANGSVYVEQTAATTFQGSYTDSASSTSGVVSNDLTATTSGTPYLINYRHLTGEKNRLFINGIVQTVPGVNTNANTLSGNFTAGIGANLSTSSTRWNGGIAEMIVYNYKVPQADRWKIESYLAIKYGITLGVNGTSQDYVDSDNRVIWDQSDNAGYNYNVTGIGQDDKSELNQKQSKSINTTDDITIGIKDIATNNSTNTNAFFADKTFLIWGHDNGATTATTDITKDFGAGTGVTANVNVTPIVRKWKMVVTDSIPTIKLSIPESMVSATNPGGEEYVMIVADDALFTTNVTSATMEDVGTELEVDFYFEGTKYITFGSTPEVDLGSRSVFFDGTDSYITAGDVNDLANMDYTISAWVKRDSIKFDIISKRNYFHEAPGPPSETYTHGYSFRINTDGKFRMVWRDPEDSANNVMETSAMIPSKEWHHIAATYDSGTNMTNLYIDGYLEDSDNTLNAMNTPSDAHFIIGAAHHIKRQQKAKGNVDEVRVWDVTLTGDQIRYIMNQEIEENGALNADGKVLPLATTKNEIMSIPWNNLIAYYPMSMIVFGSIKDESNSGNDASMINYDGIDVQTAPLPYKTIQNGDWDDSATWENGNVQYLPGVDSYLDALETIDYNIVQIDHNVTMDNSDNLLIPASRNGNRTLLGLIINSGELQIAGSNATNTGYALTVSHYLKLDGTIDLEGESQLIQTVDSDLDTSSSGSLERDQQGTRDLYTYNYWSSPVGRTNTSNNNVNYTLPEILNDGLDSANPLTINFLTSGYNGTPGTVGTTPIGIADYWIWKYANRPTDNYPSWQHIRSNGLLNIGEGFTMKGVEDTGGLITQTQNYVFSGKPNNGEITLSLSAGNDYLIGNPYPSAIDANEFILDNISDGLGRAASNIINGTLYFWDHFAVDSHLLKEYQGGYATYTLIGTTVAISNDTRINNTGASGTKTPGQYIPVGQGFYVVADTGGTITFKNSQRTFVTEASASSSFLKPGNTKKQKSKTQKGKIDNRQKIKLMFDSPDGYHRQLLVGVDEHTTNGCDIGYDAPLIEDNKEDMFWVFSDNEYIIQAVNNFNLEQKLPMGIRIGKEGIASIKIDDLENISNDLDIYLNDKELDIYHNLRDGNYEVYLPVGNHLDRFEITFSNGSSSNSLDVDDIEDTALQVYFSNEKESIIVHNPTLKDIESIEMFNILGQSLLQFEPKTNTNYIEYNVSQIKTGSYILKIETKDGKISKKVLVK
ncbi:LamG-like jellyroll fold domain-containing protein [Flavivirga spongiicola]|uniref:T9SS type A sorting domain-containing protein n=1 Tax=Flavivirga spongiicola TaxID=421621 RepID=A0ABU7XQT0_9FLAO|nr:LamG-like jellyroll fold domain-containing protein [Flavivirga sp. MEBiC05379]MDO5981846.1 LamG-like jellyroll fold domain-containing protein [Flavivirga sp. MEBiC05379]